MLTLKRLHLGGPTQIGPITIFPVWSEAAPVEGLEVPRPSNIQVVEQAAASVAELSVMNTAGRPLLVAEGTIFDGGLQTRVVASDIYIEAGATARMDVRCVEQGRWHGADAQHVVDSRAPISVVAALRGLGEFGDSQSKVWRRVSQLEQSYGNSPTGSLLDLMAKEELNSRMERRAQAKERVRQDRVIDPRNLAQVQRFANRVLPGQTGVLIGIGGEPLALEVHTSPQMLRAQLRQLLSVALLDAVNLPAVVTPGRIARSFVDEILHTSIDPIGPDEMFMRFAGSGRHAHIRGIGRVGNRMHQTHLSVINQRHELALAA